MTRGTLTDALRETLVLFEEPGMPQTTPEVAARLDLGRRSTYNRLERLVEHGQLETKKVGASARVWWQPLTTADTLTRLQRAVTEDLTDRQQATLEAAVYSGFFEWPRKATGEELAESFGIAAPTFSQHLRKAQKRVFSSTPA